MAAFLQPATHNPQNYQLIMLYICPKFRENILKDFRVIEGAGFVMDRQTDRQIDNCGKNKVSVPDGG